MGGCARYRTHGTSRTCVLMHVASRVADMRAMAWDEQLEWCMMTGDLLPGVYQADGHTKPGTSGIKTPYLPARYVPLCVRALCVKQRSLF